MGGTVEVDRTLRYHFGGKWESFEVEDIILHTYIGGEFLDSGVIEGNIANWLDFDDWVSNCLGVLDDDTGLKVWWLEHSGIRKPIDDSDQFEEMWEKAVKDSGGFTHVYAETFEVGHSSRNKGKYVLANKKKTLGIRPQKSGPIKQFKHVGGTSHGQKGVDRKRISSREASVCEDGSSSLVDESVRCEDEVHETSHAGSSFSRTLSSGNVDGATGNVDEATESVRLEGLDGDVVDLHGFTLNLDSIDDENQYVSDHSSLEDEELEPLFEEEPKTDNDNLEDRDEAVGEEEVRTDNDNQEERDEAVGEEEARTLEESEEGIEVVLEDQSLIDSTFYVEDDDEVYIGEGRSLEGLQVHQRWNNVDEARLFLRNYAIQNHFAFSYVKNEPNRLVTKCKDEDCSWRCTIRRMNDSRTMRCRKLVNVHTCIQDRNPMASAPWIVEKIEMAMRVHHRTFTPAEIIDYIWLNHKLTIFYWQAWHSKMIALEKLHGNYDESFRMVPELCAQVLASNPLSICKFSRDETYNTFTGLALSFKARLDGFRSSCRPLLGLDGCFLKGRYGGCLLSIIALDGNNGMFPVAVYICQGEDEVNWTKFLEIMADELLKHPLPLTFMSDRQKGLDNAVHAIFGTVNQRFCFRHMVKNLHRAWRGIDDLVWKAAKAWKISEFNKVMDEIGLAEPEAKAWLEAEHPSLWARAHFDPTTKSDHTTNNFTEAFNSWILTARDKPIVVMVAKIMTMLMKLIHNRRTIGSSWSDTKVVPRVEEAIKKMSKYKNEYLVGGSNEHTFQVTHAMGRWFEVNLQAKTCSCCQWQLTGFPCVHAVCVISLRRLPWHEFYSPYLTGEYYKRVYSGFIRPMQHEHDWNQPTTIMLPPFVRRAPGRPRVRRRRGDDEEVAAGRDSQNQCSRCGIFGHNVRSCQGGAVGGNVRVRGARGGAGVVVNVGGRPRKRARRPVFPVPVNQDGEPVTGGATRGRRGGTRGGRGGASRGGRGGATTAGATRGGRGGATTTGASRGGATTAGATTDGATTAGASRGGSTRAGRGGVTTAGPTRGGRGGVTRAGRGGVSTVGRGGPIRAVRGPMGDQATPATTRTSGATADASTSRVIPPTTRKAPQHSRQLMAVPYSRPPRHPRSHTFIPPTTRTTRSSQQSSQASNDV